MMPTASLANYPAFVKHGQLSSTNQFNPDQSANNLSSNSSTSSSSSFDLPALINSSFLQSEFQRNIAQFTNQLTMTGQNELISNNNNLNGTTDHNLQYSEDQIISTNKKLSFSIDSLVNDKHSALNKQTAALFNGLNGTSNLNSIKKENDLSAQSLTNNFNALAAALVLSRNGNSNSLQANLQKMNKDEARGSPISRLISPCSSTSSVNSDQNQKQPQNNQLQNVQQTSDNNSPRPSSTASHHSSSQQSASQLLMNAAQLQNSYTNNNNNNGLPVDGNQSFSNSKNSLTNKIKVEDRSRSPHTATTTNSRVSNSPSFTNNMSGINNSPIKESPSLNIQTEAALLQHIQQQQLRQQIQQLQQVNSESAIMQHMQHHQQQLRQFQQQGNHPLPSVSPHLQTHQNQPPQSNSSTPQQTTSTGPPQTSPFQNNTAAAILNQLRANSMNGAVPNPLNGLNPVSQPNLSNFTPGLSQLGLNAAAAAAASMNSPLNSLMNPSLNPLSPPRPHALLDYQALNPYRFLMPNQSFYPINNQFGFPYFMGMARKPKRVRTAFNPNQLLQLEQAFEKNQYVVGQERKNLATSLGLSETQVKVWFQNRRMISVPIRPHFWLLELIKINTIFYNLTNVFSDLCIIFHSLGTKHKRQKTEGEDPSKSPLSDNNDKCFSGDEEIDDEDTEIDPDGFNNEELKMQIMNSNYNPFQNGFNNLQANHPAEFLYSRALAVAMNNHQNLRTSSNTVTTNQSTTSLAQQS